MTVEYSISRTVNAKINSNEMFPPKDADHEESESGLENYEFYKATGQNMLSVLKEDFLKRNNSFTNQEIINEVRRILKLSPDESETLFTQEERESTDDSSTIIDKYLSVKFMAYKIKPSFVPEVFRGKAKAYGDKSRLEMIAKGDGDYLLGSEYWMWVSTG